MLFAVWRVSAISICFIEWAKADSLGRNAEWCQTKMVRRGGSRWFTERVHELELQDGAPAPILLGRHLLEMGMQPGRASAKSRKRFTRCSWMAESRRWMKLKRGDEDDVHRLHRLHR